MTLFLQTAVNGIFLGGVFSAVAVGLSLIFGVMEVINFAQGEFVMLGAFTAYWIFVFLGLNPLFTCLLIFFVFSIAGYILQKTIVNYVVEAPPLMSLVLLFGIAIALRSGALYLWSGDYRAITFGLTGTYLNFFGIHVSILKFTVLIMTVSSVFGLFLFLQKTKTGTAIQATAQDKETAKLLGVNTNRVYNITFAIGIGITALGGALLASFQSIFPTMGIRYTLFAFFVVVLGGMGYLPGTLIGAMILGLSHSFITMYIGSRYVYLLTFFMLYLLLLVSPKGILGKGR